VAPRRQDFIDFRESSSNCLEIGVVNNMADAALEATERQFRSLLAAVADGIVVRLTFYALPDVPRGDSGRDYVRNSCCDIRDLWDQRLDGLIVTGTEPCTSNIIDEPYWGSFTRLLEWAEHHTHSTVWSCLAAHAAVLHLDGVARQTLPDKRFGVFDCTAVSKDPLTADAPSRLHVPHSRWNDVPEDALLECGYRVLIRSAEAGVDMFVKQRKSLFVFVQGHPEYEADTLLREYRRDIRRFLTHERETYPSIPVGYFNQATVRALKAFENRARADRTEEMLSGLPISPATGAVINTWQPTAVRVYRNWLLQLCAQKQRRLRARTFERSSSVTSVV
jgi:homoserine O-succinyltransferase